MSRLWELEAYSPLIQEAETYGFSQRIGQILSDRLRIVRILGYDDAQIAQLTDNHECTDPNEFITILDSVIENERRGRCPDLNDEKWHIWLQGRHAEWQLQRVDSIHKAEEITKKHLERAGIILLQ